MNQRSKGVFVKKTIYVPLVASLFVALTGCNREPSIQEQFQAAQEKRQAEQREAINMLKQKAAGGEKAKP